ncbi:hypothetical protein ACPCHT_03060 [Nucisporomicrobium flavum]|uniref:hypothetical protein n=1 Tax=Nucisporomicrobium flavum TaxID=2785915 RepID=UPI003C2DC7A7
MNGRAAPRPAHHRADHDRLLRRLDWGPVGRAPGRALDAIIVPASRRAQRLGPLVDLASDCGTTLVVLASHDCVIEDVAALVASRPSNARVVLAEVPLEAGHDPLRLATSAEGVRALSGDRSSNLSLKRNVGLLLARYRGWQKIMFVDDDIVGITRDQVARVVHHLETNRFAGFKTLDYPDNSVVCHASRLAGRPQGIFVSGAALGVNTAGDRPLEVFPDVYNEDWFAFADEARRTGVAHVGNIRQLEFNPFDDPLRAKVEEFGDLVAEGLYALFTDGGGLPRATARYWERCIDERRTLIAQIRRQLKGRETHQAVQAAKSLQEASHQLDHITPEDCVRFLGVWQEDRARFERWSRAAHGRGYDYRAAFDALGLQRWQEARFGVERMTVNYGPARRSSRNRTSVPTPSIC